MSTTTPAATGPLKRHSLGLRLWHWSSAAVILGLLTTILFLEVILDRQALSPRLLEVLHGAGVSLTEPQVRKLLHEVREPIWDWHIRLGVTLSLLLALRLIVELVQPARQRFLTKFRSYLRPAVVADPTDARHGLLVKLSYLAFYLMLLVMVSTGLLLIYADDVDAIHRLEHSIKEVHEFTMYLVIAFTVVHVIGVTRAEVTRHRGIVSDMVNGGQAD